MLRLFLLLLFGSLLNSCNPWNNPINRWHFKKSFQKTLYFEGWSLSKKITPLTADRAEQMQVGHLLVPGESTVIFFEKNEKGIHGTCYRFLIELPNKLSPSIIENPTAYYQIISCGYTSIFYEKPLRQGMVKITHVDSDSIKAHLDLDFETRRLKTKERFQIEVPPIHMIKPDFESIPSSSHTQGD